MIKLSEFVSEALLELIRGIEKAQQEDFKHGGAVNPKGCHYLNPGSGTIQHKETTRIGQDVAFDLEVTVVEGESSKAGAGLFVVWAGLGGQTQSNAQSRAVNRIQFKVPVIFPKGEYSEDEGPGDTTG